MSFLHRHEQKDHHKYLFIFYSSIANITMQQLSIEKLNYHVSCFPQIFIPIPVADPGFSQGGGTNLSREHQYTILLNYPKSE